MLTKNLTMLKLIQKKPTHRIRSFIIKIKNTFYLGILLLIIAAFASCSNEKAMSRLKKDESYIFYLKLSASLSDSSLQIMLLDTSQNELIAPFHKYELRRTGRRTIIIKQVSESTPQIDSTLLEKS